MNAIQQALVERLRECLPMASDGPDHKTWCSVLGADLRAAIAALEAAPTGAAQAAGEVPPAEPGAEVPTRPLDDMGRVVFEALGEVSMCWDPRPYGVFESSMAASVGDRLVEAVRTYGDSRAVAAVAADRAGRKPLTDEFIIDVTTNLFPCWREDIQDQFVLRVVRAVVGGIQAGE